MARPQGFVALGSAVLVVALVVVFGGVDVRSVPRWAKSIHAGEARPVEPDVEFISTPIPVVERMLAMADVGSDDLVYDLGCGDGRILFAAAQRHGAHGVGIDIDAQLVAQCRKQAQAESLGNLLRFRQADIFATDFSDATVVTLYLLPHLNDQLVPQLLQLRPGTRIVSHAFGIDGYPADKLVLMPNEDGGEPHKIYYWVAPLEKGLGFVKR